MYNENKPINWLFEEQKIISTKYSLRFKNKELILNNNELNDYLNNSSIEDIKNINCFIKIYKFDNDFEKWIVLFSDDTPSKINDKITYYSLDKDKSILNYGFNILNNLDEKIILILLNK